MASFGVEGGKAREFCKEHAKQRTVEVARRKCENGGCSKVPSFGADGGRKRAVCCEYAKLGMVNLVSRRCCQEGCTKRSSYGVDGSKKAEFCREHSKSGMVNVRSTRCSHEGCAKEASYGAKGSRKREFCSHTLRWVVWVDFPRRTRLAVRRGVGTGSGASAQQRVEALGPFFPAKKEGGALPHQPRRGTSQVVLNGATSGPARWLTRLKPPLH